ncbi:DNA-3-methyladenine glycosylase I [Veillonella caviae]|uniref:DNA-3-methyladenine glycosylase I n=1 Tax=Veillonella caviae TaxID=248316 RepID=UPI0023F65667|nr:DNA-3-methyladenine glycosylase I [Veillonella caviae]MCI7693482.1 DNA-3-methyladenine glycosylase I [Veillonella caviae]MDY5254561.1 DNA-3-methyladenine glycosylase I [Veillonella caviae]MDY5409374.1 DNA-3-methyladenine glycosylase I [Veillonella caviae]
MHTCEWPTTPLYQDYHDHEWGRPVHDDKKQFEHLMLEVMQCGLSWITVLNKREDLRIAFDDFDYKKIALYTDADVERIMNAPNVIRSERKIRAIIHNAQRFIEVQRDFGSFCNYIWAFTGGKTLVYEGHPEGNIPAKNELSERISNDLKQRGFKFLGPVTIYSHLQASGLINDHGRDCPCFDDINESTNIVYKREDA